MIVASAEDQTRAPGDSRTREDVRLFVSPQICHSCIKLILAKYPFKVTIEKKKDIRLVTCVTPKAIFCIYLYIKFIPKLKAATLYWGVFGPPFLNNAPINLR